MTKIYTMALNVKLDADEAVGLITALKDGGVNFHNNQSPFGQNAQGMHEVGRA
ncbi:hypothetical protein WMZ97_10670 [Lentibacillus sp. N15]